MYKVILILDKYFLKLSGVQIDHPPPPLIPSLPEKNTLKKLSLIRVKTLKLIRV